MDGKTRVQLRGGLLWEISNEGFHWNAEAKVAFDDLKMGMTIPLVLVLGLLESPN